MGKLVYALARLYLITTQLLFVRARRRAHWALRLASTLGGTLLLALPLVGTGWLALTLVRAGAPMFSGQPHETPAGVVEAVVAPPAAAARNIPAQPDSVPAGTLGDGRRVAAQVVGAVDGDSIEVRIGETIEQVHLLGIDTPEPGMCYGDRAAARASALTKGQLVELESDPSQTNRDKYGRLLRSIWLPDGQLLNAVLLDEGLAFEYTYYDAPARQADFQQRERAAQLQQIGLWSAATCDGAGRRPDRRRGAVALTLPAGLAPVPVARVIDGDTIEVVVEGAAERVRLIGIDTPETGRCYADAATAHLTELLRGGQVLLERDPSQDDRDKYGRLLRYVWLPDGVLVNAALVQGGFAYEYTYRVQYAYEPQFMQLEHEAHGVGRGLWSPAICDTKAGRRYSAAYRTN
jgi:micrococcal nuclease